MELRFVHGDRYAELFPTAQGLIIVEGLVQIESSRLHLVELLIEPFEAPALTIGLAGVLAIRKELFRQARAEGYTEVELNGIRMSGAYPNRPVQIRRSL